MRGWAWMVVGSFQNVKKTRQHMCSEMIDEIMRIKSLSETNVHSMSIENQLESPFPIGKSTIHGPIAMSVHKRVIRRILCQPSPLGDVTSRSHEIFHGAIRSLKSWQAMNVCAVFLVTMAIFPGVVVHWLPLAASSFRNSKQLYGNILIGCFQVTAVGCHGMEGDETGLSPWVWLMVFYFHQLLSGHISYIYIYPI